MTEKIETAAPQHVGQSAPENIRSRSSLRPPTLMIDLLFGALMLFAFQMGYVDRPVVSHNIELPSKTSKAKKSKKRIYTVIPILGKKGKWLFKVNNGKLLSALQIKKEVRKKGRTPVIVFPHTTDLQSYLEADQELRRHGLKPGLAVQNKKGR